MTLTAYAAQALLRTMLKGRNQRANPAWHSYDDAAAVDQQNPQVQNQWKGQ